MKPETRLELKIFWNGHLHQWKETSLSQALYCKKHGLLVHRFGYWKRKLIANTNTLLLFCSFVFTFWYVNKNEQLHLSPKLRCL